MAMNDWEQTVNREDIEHWAWENKKTDKIINITAIYYQDALTGFMVSVFTPGDARDTTWRKFNTKQQAMNYAKKYMRSH